MDCAASAPERAVRRLKSKDSRSRRALPCRTAPAPLAWGAGNPSGTHTDTLTECQRRRGKRRRSSTRRAPPTPRRGRPDRRCQLRAHCHHREALPALSDGSTLLVEAMRIPKKQGAAAAAAAATAAAVHLVPGGGALRWRGGCGVTDVGLSVHRAADRYSLDKRDVHVGFGRYRAHLQGGGGGGGGGRHSTVDYVDHAREAFEHAREEQVAAAARAALAGSRSTTGGRGWVGRWCGGLVILPTSKRLRWWDTYVLVLLAFNSIEMPLRVAFGALIYSNGTLTLFQWLELLVDLTFIVDCALNFVTAYVDGVDSFVMSHAAIARRYLQTWFLDRCARRGAL